MYQLFFVIFTVKKLTAQFVKWFNETSKNSLPFFLFNQIEFIKKIKLKVLAAFKGLEVHEMKRIKYRTELLF